jgi:hypothetical protein
MRIPQNLLLAEHYPLELPSHQNLNASVWYEDLICLEVNLIPSYVEKVVLAESIIDDALVLKQPRESNACVLLCWLWSSSGLFGSPYFRGAISNFDIFDLSLDLLFFLVLGLSFTLPSPFLSPEPSSSHL